MDLEVALNVYTSQLNTIFGLSLSKTAFFVLFSRKSSLPFKFSPDSFPHPSKISICPSFSVSSAEFPRSNIKRIRSLTDKTTLVWGKWVGAHRRIRKMHQRLWWKTRKIVLKTAQNQLRAMCVTALTGRKVERFAHIQGFYCGAIRPRCAFDGSPSGLRRGKCSLLVPIIPIYLLPDC